MFYMFLSDCFLWWHKPFLGVRHPRIYTISDTPHNILITIVFSLWLSKSLHEVDIDSIPISVYPGRINPGKNGIRPFNCVTVRLRGLSLLVKGLFLCWEIQESFQVPRTEHLPTTTSLHSVKLGSGNGLMNTSYGEKGATTEKLLHFSRPRGPSKMLSVIKWCVDTALKLLTEMS